MAWLREDTIDEKVRNQLVYDVRKPVLDAASGGGGGGGGQTESDRLKEERQKLKDKMKQIMSDYTSAVAKFKGKVSEAATKVAQCKMDNFKAWHAQKKSMKQASMPPEAIKLAKTAHKKSENQAITDILNGYDGDIQDFIDATAKVNPKVASKMKHEAFKKQMRFLGETMFATVLKEYLKMARKLFKAQNQKQLKQFDNDKILEKIAEIPMKIEEKIQEIKDKLDKLLGKFLPDLMNPYNPKFDIDKLLKKIDQFLNPVISATNPLKAICKAPVIGDLAAMMSLLAGGGSDYLTQEEILAMCPKPPELDSQLMDKILAIKDDIIMVCQTLPMVLIRALLEMVNVIWEKLKIITSVIPLGNMFPLGLITSAIEAAPKIWDLILVLPDLVKKAVIGKVKKKFHEAMALTKPKPNFDKGLLFSLLEDFQDAERVKKELKSRKDYKKVMEEIYENKLKKEGYTKSQAETVLDNYKKIYNGTDQVVGNSNMFVDNNQEQVLEEVKDSDGKVIKQKEKGFTEDMLERTKPSVDDFEKYFNACIDQSDLSAYLTYSKIKTTKSLIGEFYDTYRSEFEKYGWEVVLRDKLKPNEALRSIRNKK